MGVFDIQPGMPDVRELHKIVGYLIDLLGGSITLTESELVDLHNSEYELRTWRVEETGVSCIESIKHEPAPILPRNEWPQPQQWADGGPVNTIDHDTRVALQAMARGALSVNSPSVQALFTRDGNI